MRYQPTNAARTLAVLDMVARERVAQEAAYGPRNARLDDGSGPETRWLGPYTQVSAERIQEDLRADYEEYEDETNTVTWTHLVREEVAEAFAAPNSIRLAQELIQVAALCVSWVERLYVD